ncbi:preprotein translocase subunit SecG [Cognatilysobacter bugurensis]|uniref:Protein-export membrane protein SecG n=1 Tax=Cognatilysobacter bugurensis TaxID=543356 RepID=A0A918SVK6_9GAMM|nr:preprotein translocase subunit SecG [Lysobacter bugurensis]GHA71095.1 preprotein translocase subunit SecG [Lysobacter bugurensis]
MLLLLNIAYVLIAISMIALILMQRGAGAQAGSGFGGGASSTVFGARGSSNFLSKATKWLAVTFFAISLFMAWYATNLATGDVAAGSDLGVMSQVPTVPAGEASVPVVPTAPAGAVPQVPVDATPAAPATNQMPEQASDR